MTSVATMINLVVLVGRLARPPEQRELPSGDRLVAYEVTVARPGARAESVPVVWMEAPAAAADHDVDEVVLVVGRVRRRFFRAGGATQSRTEVVADTVVPTRLVKRARAALEAASNRMEEALG
ncbi:MAG TPA: single-stranded DNA-binding protein [Acidimicrobiales bacterium]|nr:single-stranded DNA-binding protein [Acidimicrobiales bacterium]